MCHRTKEYFHLFGRAFALLASVVFNQLEHGEVSVHDPIGLPQSASGEEHRPNVVLMHFGGCVVLTILLLENVGLFERIGFDNVVADLPGQIFDIKFVILHLFVSDQELIDFSVAQCCQQLLGIPGVGVEIDWTA